MTHPAQAFVDAHVAHVAPMARDLEQAYWDLNVTGNEEHAKRRTELAAAITKIYANADEFARVKEWHENGIADPLLQRQIDHLYRAYLANQKDDATIERTVRLESDVEMIYNNHRGEFEGKPTSDNDLRDVLVGDNDSGRRKAAWEASKQVGAKVREKVLELVRLRNSVARKVGFDSYYLMSLELQELNEAEVFGLLDDLDAKTQEPFRAAKARLDRFLARRFGVEVGDLRPWHYADFFFQDAPADDNVDLSPLFANKDIVDVAVRTYDGVGLDVRPILERSDLFPREGKSQHAFCISVDREQDVRTLCNLKADERWMGTLLHELGHGVYDYYLNASLPYLLREPAHTLSTEAIAMIFGRLTKNDHWLRTVAGIANSRLDAMLPHIREYESLAMLIFVRWCLVMTHFERDLYANPERDLNTLWWDYVERYQMLARPEGRDEPDWAAKIHLATAPVYYHNYLLGEMMASQLDAYITRNINPLGVASSPDIGDFLKTRLFAFGARYDWNETLERVTGERLTPTYFAKQFVDD